MKKSLLLTHITAAIIISALILLVYASAQQAYRAPANDPQIQIARDVSEALSNRKSIDKLFPADTINLEKSLAVFAELFNSNGKPLQSSGLLNGKFPEPPFGVFKYTNEYDEDVLTWQPQSDVRMAMVFEKVNNPNISYVAVGRSLKETEVRESNLLNMGRIAWIACIAILIIHFFLQNYLQRKNISTSKQL